MIKAIPRTKRTTRRNLSSNSCFASLRFMACSRPGQYRRRENQTKWGCYRRRRLTRFLISGRTNFQSFGGPAPRKLRPHPCGKQAESYGVCLQNSSIHRLGCDLTGVFCTSGSEREFTLEGSWYADEEIQAGTDRDTAAAG